MIFSGVVNGKWKGKGLDGRTEPPCMKNLLSIPSPPGKGRTADTLQLEGGVGWANPHEAMLVNNTVKGLGELRHTECSMSQ